ncbi:zinc finger protein [Cinnamomum micranthum f. kanehirae]|uniref:Zinc finger protein n=1 Tax=Cinnamomum micranthum f. kanehirae TaxID=337451 RepID=A0A443NUI9_9MAGN|nr:zinc finger protein [Cinnamomum micranthum f. kanehirae]
MVGGGSEQDSDEFEMLLGEIPKATYENSDLGDSRPSVLLPNLEAISTQKEARKSTSFCAFTNSDHPPQAASQGSNTTIYSGSAFKRNDSTKASDSLFDQKLQNKGNLDGGKTGVKSDFITVFGKYVSNLPDDQSLTSAFEQLSFKDDKGCAAAGSVKIKTLPICPNLSQGQYPNGFKKSLSGLDPVGMTLHSSPNGMGLVDQALELEKFKGELNQRSMSCPPIRSLLDNLDTQQRLPAYSGAIGAMPFAPGMHGYQMLPNSPAPELEFSASAFQQPYYLDAQSSPYVQTQTLNRFHVAREQQMERESLGRMYPQYLQQLQNQGSASHPIQANSNLSMELISGKPRQQMHFETPISHQLKQANGSSHCTHHSDLMLMGGSGCCHSQEFCGSRKTYRFAHGERQTSASGFTSPPLSVTDFQGVQVFDRRAKHIFPEKFLTRNSLKAITPNFIEEFELLNHVNSKGQVFSNGHSHSPFQLDDQSSRLSSPDNADLRYTLRLQLEKYNSVDEVVGRIYLLAKDQHGCRFLQRKIIEGTSEDVHKIIIEIIDHIVELMTNPFGNYLVQKLLELCNEDQRMHIIRAVTRKAGELVRVSCDMHGTRAVQKIIETIKTPEQISLVVSSLKHGIVELIKDMNGNHVAQRCLQYLMPKYRKFLFDAAAAHCIELATDRHGCCVLQKCLQNSDGEQKQMLMSEITSNALLLSQDPFGNYVVQNIIDQGVPWATENVLNQLEGNYGYLSMQKYSSNVVEKCLKFAGEEHCTCIIQELIHHPHLEHILQDPYGNYVVQSALAESKGALHAALVEAISPHLPALRNSPYGKKILSRNSLKK